jgi:hypothetical protein
MKENVNVLWRNLMKRLKMVIKLSWDSNSDYIVEAEESQDGEYVKFEEANQEIERLKEIIKEKDYIIKMYAPLCNSDIWE